MTQFKISAPGRIVLSGEHAMLYEKRTIMASLDRRTTLNFCELPDEQGIIKIQFPKDNKSLEIPLEKVRTYYSRYIVIIRNRVSDNYTLRKHVNRFITTNGMWSTYERKFSLQLFFLLLFYIARNEKLEIRSFHVNVSTDLSIGGTLGSSTSYAVCLAACFIHWLRLQKGAHDEFDEDDLEKICTYSTKCEKYIQDYAFEIDNKVCTYGKIVNFQYSNFENNNMSTMDVPEMKILLIDSRIRQSNRELVQRMAEIKRSDPDRADSIFHRVNEISERICSTLNEITNNNRNPNSLQIQERLYVQLQKYIRENQQILYESHLSHPRLDYICSIAKSYGFAGKLTGFGGRFVYIPLTSHTQEEQITNLSKKLLAEGFNVTKTSVSCSGVRIHD